MNIKYDTYTLVLDFVVSFRFPDQIVDNYNPISLLPGLMNDIILLLSLFPPISIIRNLIVRLEQIVLRVMWITSDWLNAVLVAACPILTYADEYVRVH